MRLGWFTPWPPASHPAARRTRDLARALAARGDQVDLIVAGTAGTAAPPPASPDLPVAQVLGPDAAMAPHGPDYDLLLYTVVNDPAGAFMWPHVLDRPGVVVLHDLNLYRVRASGAAGDPSGYRDEFAWNHPATRPDAAELAIAGLDGAYHSLWPATRAVIERARAVIVPSPAAAQDLRARFPDVSVAIVPSGLAAPEPAAPGSNAAGESSAARESDAVVFGVFGDERATAERRVPQILRAFASTLGRVPGARLLLAGVDVDLASQPRHVAAAIERVARPTEEQRAGLMQAIDVAIDLHWPPMSGPTDTWLAALAAGRAAVIMDTPMLMDMPLLDPRSWQPTTPDADPVAVAVDILDEDHSLRLACYRLASDPALRDRLGRAARAHFSAAHTLEQMTTAFVRAIDSARDRPSQAPAGVPWRRPARPAAGEGRASW